MKERLQKLLSAAGVCSRRRAEDYIRAGRVAVNGVPATLGERADPALDRVTLDGAPLRASSKHTYLMLNKPRGFVTTLSDEKGRPTAAELVAGCGTRVWPVGRLDMDSEGLLLFTNDGELTHRLLHPGHGAEKEYLVRVLGDVEAALPRLRRPMWVDGEELCADRVEWSGASLSITLHQGKNRQVRRMCAAAGLTVTRLQRIREDSLRLGDLPVGKWRFLTKKELVSLGL